MRRTVRCLMWVLALATAPALGQVINDRPPGEQPAQQSDEDRRREWRDRMERMRTATPEERDRMRADMYVRMLTRTYDLNEDQQKRVRDEVVKMGDEYRQSLGDDAGRLDEFRREMDNYWRDRRRDDGGRDEPSNPMEDPKFRDIMSRMQEIQQRHPIDWEGGIKRIEAMLPADQAATGRARREQWMQQFGGQGGGPGRGGPGGWGGGPGGWNRMNRDREDNGRDGARSRRRDRRNDDRSREWRSRRGDRRENPGDNAPAGAAPSQPAPAPVITLPVHPWDTYTENFIRLHALDKNQTSAAWAIVKGLKEREAPIRHAQESERAAAAKIPETKARDAKVKQLDAPIDALFKELQQRLDALLTAAQRSGSGAR